MFAEYDPILQCRRVGVVHHPFALSLSKGSCAKELSALTDSVQTEIRESCYVIPAKAEIQYWSVHPEPVEGFIKAIMNGSHVNRSVLTMNGRYPSPPAPLPQGASGAKTFSRE